MFCFFIRDRCSCDLRLSSLKKRLSLLLLLSASALGLGLGSGLGLGLGSGAGQVRQVGQGPVGSGGASWGKLRIGFGIDFWIGCLSLQK